MRTASRRTKRHKPVLPAAHAGSGNTPAHKDGGPATGVVSVLDPAPQPEALPCAEEWVQAPCPYCGEELEVLVRADEDGQTRNKGCSVCCRTVALHVTWDDGELQLEADRA